jgi:hypothetical protein
MKYEYALLWSQESPKRPYRKPREFNPHPLYSISLRLVFNLLSLSWKRKSGKPRITAVGIRGSLYPQKLTLTSPTSGGPSVGIDRSRTQATEFGFFKVGLYEPHAVCVCESHPIYIWMSEPRNFIYHGTWSRLTGVLHKSGPSVSVSACVYPYRC